MVYILGTRNREYNIEGILLPKKAYNEREIELGRKSVVEIDDVQYAKLSSNPIFQSLIKNGDILIRDKAPEGQETMPELRQKLLKSKEDSAQQIADLMTEIEQLKKGVAPSEDIEALKKEALAEIKKRDDRIVQLEASIVEQGGNIPK
jgi:hypothetical protein